MKTYTQKEIAEMIGVPYSDVSFALYSVDPVAPVSKPYHYEAEAVKYALTKYYAKKRDLHMKRANRYTERINAVARLEE